MSMAPRRPTKLTAKVRSGIVEAVGLGASLCTAAAAVGVGSSTLYRWIKRGQRAERGDAIYIKFLDAVAEASAKAELADLATIRRAADGGDWRAAAWRLKHTNPERYGGAQPAPVVAPSAAAPDLAPSTASPSAPVVRLYQVKKNA